MQIYRISLFSLVLAVFSIVANAASLDVVVTHVRPTKTVCVSVYDNAGSWLSGVSPVTARCVKARGVTQTIRIEGLVPGRYAVRVQQHPNHGGVIEPPPFAVTRSGTSGGRTAGFEKALVPVGAEGGEIKVHLFSAELY